MVMRMGMFNKSMKIGEGKKYDVTQVSSEGLTAEEIAKMDKKARKLIDIYNTDEQKGLSKIELAYAMDGFASADKDNDGKLSDKELEAYANEINNDEGLSGENALSGKDLKAFLKEVGKFTKDDNKVSTEKTIDDDAIARYVKSKGLTAVEGQEDLYEKDGKYTKIVRGDELTAQRVVKDGDNFRTMTQDELDIETARERQAEIDKKAEAGGYEAFDYSDGSVYRKVDDYGRLYIYDDNKKDFVRAKYSLENGTYEAMTDDEIREEEEQIAEHKTIVQQRRDAQTPKNYTVQLGDKLDDLLIRSLKGQGLDVTEESLAAAKDKFKQNNPDAVRTNSRGVDYLYAGDVVKIAGNLEDKANADEVKQAYRAQQAQKTAAARQRAEVEVSTNASQQSSKFKPKLPEGFSRAVYYFNDYRGTLPEFPQGVIWLNEYKFGNGFNQQTVYCDCDGNFYKLQKAYTADSGTWVKIGNEFLNQTGVSYSFSYICCDGPECLIETSINGKRVVDASCQHTVTDEETSARTLGLHKSFDVKNAVKKYYVDSQGNKYSFNNGYFKKIN